MDSENSHPDAEAHEYYNCLSGYDRLKEDHGVHACDTA